MKKILMCAVALGAALAFAAPASAKDGRGYGHGYKKGHHARQVIVVRSNKYGMRRGHERARYVHQLNRMKRYDRY